MVTTSMHEGTSILFWAAIPPVILPTPKEVAQDIKSKTLACAKFCWLLLTCYYCSKKPADPAQWTPRWDQEADCFIFVNKITGEERLQNQFEGLADVDLEAEDSSDDGDSEDSHEDGGSLVGKRCEVRYRGGDLYHPARVARVQLDGHFDVVYGDGKREFDVPPELVRILDQR